MSESSFLRDVADRWSLRRISDDALPAIAVEALERGFDSPKLRMLAGWTPSWNLERRDLFIAALAELGVGVEDYDGTLRRVIHPVLDQVADGRFPVSTLADYLLDTFGERVARYGHPLYLLYVYAADYLEMPDEPGPDEMYAALAQDEARRLLARLRSGQPLDRYL